MDTAKQKSIKQLAITIVVLLALNLAGGFIFKRLDLTKDKRYTLSDTSLELVESVHEPLYIDVFLEGDFPGEFQRLQDETRQLLQEYEAINPDVKFNFFNPIDKAESSAETKRDLIYTIFKMDNPNLPEKTQAEVKKSIEGITDIDKAIFDTFTGSGMKPAGVSVNDKGKQSETLIFPWAIATYKGKTVKIPLLKNVRGANTAEKVQGSVQHLEYAFADAFDKLIREKQKKIVVLQGNGEMPGLYMGSLIKQLRESYHIGPFTMDSVAKDPMKTLKQLQQYDLAIIAKPTEKFTEEEKQVLDQYIINGGKTLWMLDAVQVEMDSLYNATGVTPALPRDLNLNDMLFKYGIRITPDIVKDEMATPLKLATGAQGSAAQYQQYIWRFAPFAYPDSINQNPIVKNLGGVKLEFASPIDTLKNGIKKNVLLASSRYSKKVGTPLAVRLDMVAEETKPTDYTGQGFLPMAVLLEGNFRSMYENRLLPFKDPSYKITGRPGKMIVISDGDVAKNQFDKNGEPLELGYDKWTEEFYENKDFMLNCVNYLLDDNGLINIRTKEVELPMLNTQKVYDNYLYAELVTVGLPLLVLALFGILFTWLRKRAYSSPR
jgi:gliding-associated putative ABC transporter substrate-binding component GldG